MSIKKEKIVVMTPEERLKKLSNASNAVEVDPHIPPLRYYRSGIEMVRMAKVYHEEGSLENAYVLYMKYMTLFIEKIRNHPDFAKVPVTAKNTNQQMLRQVLPQAEKLRQELLEQYTKEYNLYKKIKEKEEEELRKNLEREREKERPPSKVVPNAGEVEKWRKTTPVYPAPKIDDISYPDPNISDPNFDRKKPKAIVTDKTIDFRKTPHPSIDRSVKPSIDSSGTASSGSLGLRTVMIPICLANRFLMLAKHNTLSNKETCGILAGTLEYNQLIITHMIVPKQKGTADSCVTMNEEEIFDYQDMHNLITIGWIHTHPTQTAFLSSVDLHTQCPYQLLMPEAIAVVCAPKYNDTGIFVLTPQYGLEFIANCRKTGFHPHPTDPPLFMSATHIKMDSKAELTVVDFRSA